MIPYRKCPNVDKQTNVKDMILYAMTGFSSNGNRNENEYFLVCLRKVAEDA